MPQLWKYCHLEQRYCYVYVPFYITLSSDDFKKKEINYTVKIYDFIKIGAYKVRRAYKSADLVYSYEVKGELPDWDDYSFITIEVKPKKILLRQSPPWVHNTTVKLDDDYSANIYYLLRASG